MTSTITAWRPGDRLHRPHETREYVLLRTNANDAMCVTAQPPFRTTWLPLDSCSFLRRGAPPTIVGQRARLAYNEISTGAVGVYLGMLDNAEPGSQIARFKRDDCAVEESVYLGRLELHEDETPELPTLAVEAASPELLDHLRRVVGGWEAYHEATWSHLIRRAMQRGYGRDYEAAMERLPDADDVVTGERTYVFPAIPTEAAMETVTVTIGFSFTVELEDSEVINLIDGGEYMQEMEVVGTVRAEMQAETTVDVETAFGTCGCDQADAYAAIREALENVTTRGSAEHESTRCSADSCNND